MSKVVRKKNPLIAALDLGTTKVVFAIGTITENEVDVIGVGNAQNHGMRQGVVVNIEAATESITKAKEEAELMAGVTVDEVWLSVGGSHIESFDSTGMIAIRDHVVTQEDVSRVIEAAKAVAIPNDRDVLHVVPKDYIIDGQEGIYDPIGMSGVRLESSVHIITGSSAAVQNSRRCCERAGLRIKGIVLQQLASSRAVLSGDEKDMGVCVVDIGGGTCDMISFSHGAVAHTAVIPVGGHNFTHDVAMGLRTTQVNAEILKKKFGCALAEMVSEEETIEVEGVGGRQIRTMGRRNLCAVLEARAEETLSLVRGELNDAEMLNKFGSGIVLTGGSSQLPGLIEMGEYLFDIPVRKGVPVKVGGLTDIVRCASYATVVGLLLHGYDKEKVHSTDAGVEETISDRFGDWTRRVKDYFGRSLNS